MNKQERKRLFDLAEGILAWNRESILVLAKLLSELEALCKLGGIDPQAYLKGSIPTAPYPKNVSTTGLVARDKKGMYLIRTTSGLEVVSDKDLEFTKTARIKESMKSARNIRDRGVQFTFWVERDVMEAVERYMTSKHILRRSDVTRRALIDFLISEGALEKPHA